MAMDDVVSYLKTLNDNNDKIHIGITKYPLYNAHLIHITVIDMDYGVEGQFVSNLSIDNFSIHEIEFARFKKFCIQCIEYIKRKTVQFKNNYKYGMVSS